MVMYQIWSFMLFTLEICSSITFVMHCAFVSFFHYFTNYRMHKLILVKKMTSMNIHLVDGERREKENKLFSF